MKILTTRFGEIEVPENEIYYFPEGILGFSDVKQYFILDNPKGGPFKWLQAVKPPSLAFVICDPLIFKPDYKIKIKVEDVSSIKLDDSSKGIVLTILTVPKEPSEITANLLGPLIFNPQAKLAKQVVLGEAQYSTRFRIFQPKEEKK